MYNTGMSDTDLRTSKEKNLSATELKTILFKHKTWLETNGHDGEQANLKDCQLKGAVLLGADLRNANLEGAYLYWAYLKNANLDIQKLKTFDGSIEESIDDEDLYDFIFIDGEHTDWACFRDFIHSERFFNENCIVAFHDSKLIYKSLKIICELLKSRKSKFNFVKVKDSEISFLFINTFSEINSSKYFISEDLDSFYARSEAYVLLQAANNRVRSRLTLSGLKYSVRETPTVKINKGI